MLIVTKVPSTLVSVAVEFAMDPAVLKEAVSIAIASKQNSYCPYSKFPVGCALVCTDDRIIRGCNVENASYGLAICAERSAICSAVSNGHRSFKAIVVSTNTPDFVYPCGSCRQFISEFGKMDVYTVSSSGDVQKMCISELLPKSFGQGDLHNSARL